MYGIVTTVNNTYGIFESCQKNKSHHKKKANFVTMVMDVRLNCVDHFTLYPNIKLLCSTLETNVLCQYTSILKSKCNFIKGYKVQLRDFSNLAKSTLKELSDLGVRNICQIFLPKNLSQKKTKDGITEKHK